MTGAEMFHSLLLIGVARFKSCALNRLYMKRFFAE